jgi:CRISPR/Cas system-associated exonuclease Cas4 (RecB family)
MRTGEMSRYLYQLIFSRDMEIIRPGLEVRARETEALEIAHTREADLKLDAFMAEAVEGRYLSPSAVNTYIDCSLKFYLRYIAGIGEADEIQEEIDPAGFGTVVHAALNELYSEIAKRNKGQISREELSDLLDTPKAGELLLTFFKKQHFKGRKREELEGRNIIIFRVMLRYLEKIIRTDLGIAPFELVSAEDSYSRKLKIMVNQKELEIRLGGKIDRIDRVNGVLRVIDYKTGQTSQNFTTLGSLFEGNYGSRNGAALQTLFYAWLAEELYPGEQIIPGLYTMKGLFEEGFDPALKMTSLRPQGRIDSFGSLEEEYIERLKAVLQRLYDPAVPFVQRENDLKCTYCDFAALCQRKTID